MTVSPSGGFSGSPDSSSGIAEFESCRSRLLGIAYRMLGSVSDAEDMVQEAWLRWARTDRQKVESPAGWLTTVVSRLCLDRLGSARVRREQYYGTWLPEPLVEHHTGGHGAASPEAELDESISVALLLTLEKLSPAERAGFLLHEVFGHSFAEIAAILGRPEVNCRKLVSRARGRVRSGGARFPATRCEHELLLGRFLDACRKGDLEPLMQLLGDGVALYSDGGGKASALPEVLTGNEAVARFFLGIARQAGGFSTVRPAFFNGAPGVLICLDGQPVTAITLSLAGGRIARIYAHRNPDKLRWFAAGGPAD